MSEVPFKGIWASAVYSLDSRSGASLKASPKDNGPICQKSFLTDNSLPIV